MIAPVEAIFDVTGLARCAQRKLQNT